MEVWGSKGTTRVLLLPCPAGPIPRITQGVMAWPPPATAAAQTPQNSNKNAETALNLFICPLLMWSVKGGKGLRHLEPAVLLSVSECAPDKSQSMGA